MRTIEELRADMRCRHFDGLMNTTCKAGVPYEAVKDITQTPYRYPCLPKYGGAGVECDKKDYPTDSELIEEEKTIRESIEKYMGAIKAGKCPHCGKDFVGRQVGRCVYAEPCGHRLYQGRLKR